MHALFHIKTVIIPRDRYRAEGFSPRVDIGRGMITVLIFLLLPRYESDSVVTECVWLGSINNQTGCPSKTGKRPKRWKVYTNKNHVQYIHRTAFLSCCDESRGMEFNLTLKSSREPASTTEDGTWFHSLMDLGKKECWYVSFLALIYLSLWFPLVLESPVV